MAGELRFIPDASQGAARGEGYRKATKRLPPRGWGLWVFCLWGHVRADISDDGARKGARRKYRRNAVDGQKGSLVSAPLFQAIGHGLKRPIYPRSSLMSRNGALAGVVRDQCHALLVHIYALSDHDYPIPPNLRVPLEGRLR